MESGTVTSVDIDFHMDFVTSVDIVGSYTDFEYCCRTVLGHQSYHTVLFHIGSVGRSLHKGSADHIGLFHTESAGHWSVVG